MLEYIDNTSREGLPSLIKIQDFQVIICISLPVEVAHIPSSVTSGG